MISGNTLDTPRAQASRNPTDNVAGAVVVDKPLGWTSHDVVNKIRRLSGIRKVGHLGTLDPNATGVLPLLIGRATRLAQFFGGAEKRYEGVVRFGFSTDTYDAQGVPAGEPVACEPGRAALEAALESFRGQIKQVPPPVSAKKVAGVPAYKLARQNKPAQLPPVDVTIYSVEITSLEGSRVGLRIHCSAGTYVRSIAHDLGRVFGCGAHLESLRRTASGEFSIERALKMEALQNLADSGRFGDAILPSADLLTEIPAEFVDDAAVGQIRQGRTFRVSPFGPARDARRVRAIGPDGQLIAIGEARLPNVYQPVLVL